MKYKTNTINLLFVLYNIEDKQDYKYKNITNYIDKLQNKIKRGATDGKITI